MRRSRHRWPAVVAACTLLCAAGNASLFPEAAGPLEPDLSTTLRLPNGKTLSLESVRFKPAPGISKAAIPFLCGVVLRRAPAAPQALVTIGTGKTTFWACDGLAEDGVVKTRNGGWVIALVYNTSTPGTIATAPVVLVPDAGGHFHPDDKMAGRADIATLVDLRRAIAHEPQ